MLSKGELINKIGGLLASAFVRSLTDSMSAKTLMFDSTGDPATPGFKGPVIAIFWHEYLLSPFALRGKTHTAILTSQHRDANWLAESARHLGFDTIRGSTARGGSKALLEMMRGGQRNIGIACDGPRGPRRTMALGPIYLSSKLQIPIVPYGIGYDRPWRIKSWDKFAVPRPWSRSRWILGPRIQIPPRIRRDELERYRLQTEQVLELLTSEAESWARTGERRDGQAAAFRRAVPRREFLANLQPTARLKIRRVA